MERRVTALEEQLRIQACGTCRDWKPIEVVRVLNGDEEIPPSECPDCGREARKVIVLKRLERGPQ